jgi:putative FmdB family regulatory protein
LGESIKKFFLFEKGGEKMPTYDYVCDSCGHSFEKLQSMSEKPLKKCPECGENLRRVIGPGVGIIFKGSGFYETDYKKKSTSSAAACRRRNKPCGVG